MTAGRADALVAQGDDLEKTHVATPAARRRERLARRALLVAAVAHAVLAGRPRRA